MSLNKIFTYWEGPKPDYIELCQETLQKNCGEDFEIITLSSTDEHKELPINLKVDWLKANLIYKYGGFWVDADTIVMKNLKPLLPIIKEYGFAGIPGFFGGKKKNAVLKRWIDGMKQILKDPRDLTFSDLIQPLLKDPLFHEFGQFTKEMICPVYHTGDEFWKFFDNLPLREVITENNYVVALYNSAFSEEFKDMTGAEILERNWLIGKMFKKALE